MLEREEYIEQAYLFQILAERLQQNLPLQDVLVGVKEEILATTKLPLALDYLAGEIRQVGVISPAMSRLKHYFAPFQAYVMGEAEAEGGKFDISIALKILEREARFRADGATPQGLFLFQFESLCRNRLGYDRGLEAVAGDSIYNDDWRQWILTVRRQVGLIDFADMIYVRSEHYLSSQRRSDPTYEPEKPMLFGDREGRIALANRRREPLLLFAAMHRHLGYPAVPVLSPADLTPQIIPSLQRRMDRVEARMKLVEEEQKGGIDLTKFYGKQVDLGD